MERKNLLAFGIICVALLLGALFFAGCPQQKKETTPQNNATTGNATTAVAAPNISSADVPSYDSSVDSELDNLSAQLG